MTPQEQAALDAAVSALEDFISHGESGFLDEIPSRPDTSRHYLIQSAQAAIDMAMELKKPTPTDADIMNHMSQRISARDAGDTRT